ncbi:MAG: hypothetical protein V3W04_05710 [Gammaproteobacteria bacterium]
MNEAILLWGVVCSSIGLGYFVYGRRQKNSIVLISGIGLMFFPYFVSNAFAFALTAIILLVLPHFIQI